MEIWLGNQIKNFVYQTDRSVWRTQAMETLRSIENSFKVNIALVELNGRFEQGRIGRTMASLAYWKPEESFDSRSSEKSNFTLFRYVDSSL